MDNSKDNSSKVSITSDPQLDKQFFSPPDPKGDRSIFVAVPPIGIGAALALGILVYKVKMWPKMKAKGENIHIYFWNTRFLVSSTFAGIAVWSLAIADIAQKWIRKRDNITDADIRLAMYGDHKPRKLPKLKVKPYEGNPMALFKTNILEQVLLERFNAQSQSD